MKKNYFFIFLFMASMYVTHSQSNIKPVDSFAVKLLIDKANKLLYEQADSAVILATKAVNASFQLNNAGISNKAYNALGMSLYMAGKYAESVNAFKQSYVYAKAENNVVKMATAINNQANVMVEVGKLDSALLFYKEALKLRKESNIAMEIVQGYYNLGYIHKELGNFDASIENIVKSIEISDTLNNDRISGMCYTMMGVLQVKKTDFVSSNLWCKKALAIFIKSKDEGNKAIALHSIATNFIELKVYDSATVYFNNAIKIYEKLNDKRQLAIAFADYGEMLTRVNKAKEAEPYFEKSIALHNEIDNKRTLGSTYISAALCKLSLNKNIECKKYLDSALSIISTINNKPDFKNYYDVLSQYYKSINEPANSLEAYQKFVLYKDSILDEKKLKNIAEIEAKYNNNEQEKIINNQNTVLASRQKWLYIIIAIASLLAVLGYLFYRNKAAKKAEEVKKAQEKQIELNKQELDKIAETERQRISRDLHDNMGAYTSALIANVQQLQSKIGNNDETAKMQTNAESILNSLRETIWVLNNKEVHLHEFNDGFKNYCFKVLKNFENIRFEATETIVNNPILSAKMAIHLNKIMQEAVQNSIKHAAATQITYTLTDSNGIKIILSDNGKGFKVNQPNTGNGISNMQWRANEAGLQLQVTTAENEGTTITINTLK